jgi:hypothetical protein
MVLKGSPFFDQAAFLSFGWAVNRDNQVPVAKLRAEAVGPAQTWREATTWAKAHLRRAYLDHATGWDVAVSSNGIMRASTA